MGMIRHAAVADRSENRQLFPLTAAAVDMLTAVFGPVRVRYTCEGGREIGVKDAPQPDTPRNNPPPATRRPV